MLAICDRLAGGGEAIREAARAPYVALTTIDEVYPSGRTASVAAELNPRLPVAYICSHGTTARLRSSK